MSNYVEGKVIVITGAASGFGRLVAEKTAALGAAVVAVDLNSDDLATVTDQIVANGGKVEPVIADVSDRAAMHAMALQALERFDAIDVMVNNAGVMPLAFYADHALAADAWDRCIDINIKGVINGIVAVYDSMIAQGRGQIVNVSSIYGNYPVGGAAVYGATKAAVNVLSESLRQESQGKIKVTTIRPTGVPATGLGSGVINAAAVEPIVGANHKAYMETLGVVYGEDPPEALVSKDSIEYFALEPSILADQIVFAIDQPWGVSISDLTVRASGDSYVI